MSDVSVRTARASDADAVGAIQADVWRTAYAELLPAEVLAELAADQFAQVWRESLTHPPSPRHRLLVATAGAQVVGFAALVPDEKDPGIAELTELEVRPDARRHGHGSRLLNAAVDTLRANDFTTVRAWPLAEDEATRKFLERAGFAADGAWRDRIVSSAGDTVREMRLVTGIGPDSGHDDPDEHDN